MTLSAFLTAWLIHVVAAATPGPTLLMAARTGVTEGMRTVFALSMGLGIGMLVWALAAILGLAVAFTVFPGLLWSFKVAGGMILIWIAIKMWRHAPDPMPAAQSGAAPRSLKSAFRLGLSTQLANPKPALFFGAVFLGTIPRDAAPYAVALLVVAMFLNEVIITLLVTRVFAMKGAQSVYARMKSRVDRVFGGLLGLLGLKVALN